MRYEIEAVRTFGRQILERAGLPEEDAFLCADCLVTADMRGVHSHGMVHLPDLCTRIDQGTITARPHIQIQQTAPGAITVDADHSAGMVSAMRAMEKCVELAGTSGAAFAAVRRSNTYGFGAYYPMYAAARGMIGFAVCNTKAYVAPYGGRTPTLGTNPLSLAIPAGRFPDLVLDMATSEAAVNKIALAMKEGRPIPDHWAVGPDGERTTDPALAWQGALLPFGGHKGYGLQLVISLLAFALAGGEMDRDLPRAWADAGAPCDFGCFLGAIDISKFLPLDQFRQRVDQLFEAVKGGGTAPWAAEILIPGEHAFREAQEARKNGVEIPPAAAAELRQLSGRYGVDNIF